MGLAFKVVRRLFLGLMFLLAGTCNCFCDSYDADPYDDIPPVTVEFNYLVPGTASAQIATTYSCARPAVVQRHPHNAANSVLQPVVCAVAPVTVMTQNSPEFSAPLRT